MINIYKNNKEEIEVLKWNGRLDREFLEIAGNSFSVEHNSTIIIHIKTTVGSCIELLPGYYIIKNSSGGLDVCSEETLDSNYKFIGPKKRYKVIKCIKTCEACPSQWDVWDETGTYIYIRFRWSRLSASLGVLGEEVFGKIVGESGLDGVMTFEELKDFTKDVIDWGDCIEE